MRFTRIPAIVALVGLLIRELLAPLPARAVCEGSSLNPMDDVCWECIYPIKIAGSTIVEGTNAQAPSSADASTCICPIPVAPYVRYGITASLWEPARMVETVKDPWCFPAFGASADSSEGKRGFLRGTHSHVQGPGNSAQDSSVFAQAHWWIMPFWSMLEVLIDYECLELGGVDIAYITEIDPLWQDDEFSAIIMPEAFLFTNMIAQLACMADAAMSLVLPLSPLFWCMGSWGSAYPLTGHINDNDYVQGNAAVAGRLIYKLNRELVICDPGVWYCFCVPTPIWVKHNYRIQVARPTPDFMCHPLGRTGMIWEYLKNPPYAGYKGAEGNYLWIITRKRDCCMSGN